MQINANTIDGSALSAESNKEVAFSQINKNEIPDGEKTAVLSEAKSEKADLNQGKLEMADMSKAKAEKADIVKANVEKTDLNQAKLEMADMSNANAEKADISKTNLEKAGMSKANVEMADINKANIGIADRSKANVKKADINETTKDKDDTNEINVDINSPVYPEYKSTKEKIKAKQTETINVFAEGVRLNKLAQEKKEAEVTSRVKANLFTDVNHKMQELKHASVLKGQADSLDALSQVRFRTAQIATGEVVILNHQAANLKAEMNKLRTANQGLPALARQVPSKPNPNSISISSTDKLVSTVQATNSESPSNVSEYSSGKNKTVVSNTFIANEVKGSGMKKTSSGMGIKKSELIAYANVDEQTAIRNTEGNKMIVDATKPFENFSSTNTSNILKQANDNVFSYSTKAAYTASNPIPMNQSLPTGLVFKVQIGAFHSPLPDHIFKNLQPVSGETTRPGWIRYCVGLIKAYESANRVKAEMKNIGYKDAFVVAYLNGKRISMSEAFARLNKSAPEEKKMYVSIAATEASYLKSISTMDATNYMNEAYNQSMMPGGSVSLSQGTDQFEYAVQVGVYKSSDVPKTLASLMPLNTEKTKKGIYRFVTPRYSLYASAEESKKNAVSNGVKDAFIISYRNGSKVSHQSVKASNEKADVSAKMNAAKAVSNSGSTGLSSSVVYKVQLGAFRSKISDHAMSKFRNLSSDAISQQTNSAGLEVYYSGDFADMQSALLLKNTIVSKGIKDAFVIAFQNGKKIPLHQVGLHADKK